MITLPLENAWLSILGQALRMLFVFCETFLLVALLGLVAFLWSNRELIRRVGP